MYAIGQIFKFDPDILINVEKKPRPYICLGFSFGLLYLMSCTSQTDRYHHTGDLCKNPHFVLRKDGTGLSLDSVIDFKYKIKCVEETIMDALIKQNQVTQMLPPVQEEQIRKLFKTMMSKYQSSQFMQDAGLMKKIEECFRFEGYSN